MVKLTGLNGRNIKMKDKFGRLNIEQAEKWWGKCIPSTKIAIAESYALYAGQVILMVGEIKK